MPITKNQSTKVVKLNLSGLSDSEKAEAKQIAGEIIVDEIQDFLDNSKSPAIGGKFKKRLAKGGKSQLFEDGDMRAAITFAELNGDAIEVGIFKSAKTIEKLKSFNHNTGDTLPERRFIPDKSKGFKRSIMKKVDEAIRDIKDTAENVSIIEGEGIVSFSMDDIFSDDSIDALILAALRG